MIMTTECMYKCESAKVNTDVDLAKRDPHFNEVYPDLMGGMFFGEIETLLCKVIGKRVNLPSDHIIVKKGKINGNTLTFSGEVERRWLFWELKYVKS